jgi:hypothetical protein
MTGMFTMRTGVGDGAGSFFFFGATTLPLSVSATFFKANKWSTSSASDFLGSGLNSFQTSVAAVNMLGEVIGTSIMLLLLERNVKSNWPVCGQVCKETDSPVSEL